MKRKRSRKTVPIMLLWSKRDQARFIDAVERFQALTNDLEKILEPMKRRRAAKTKPAEPMSDTKGGLQ